MRTGARDDWKLRTIERIRTRRSRPWGEMTALRYLEPFLDVVRSVETSGLITSQALSAILKILKSECVSPDDPGGPACGEMHAIADAVTLCRFEATSVEDDDAVLSQILYVLVACVRCESGYALSDDDLCDVFQACYRIGHQSGKETLLLRELSKQTLSEILYHVSQRLGEIVTAAEEDGPTEGKSRRLVGAERRGGHSDHADAGGDDDDDDGGRRGGGGESAHRGTGRGHHRARTLREGERRTDHRRVD